MLIADSVGTFTIDGEKTGGFDSTNVVEFANGSQVAGRDYNIRGVSKGVACMQIPAITMDLKVTFDKDANAKPVDGKITNLDIWEANTPDDIGYARMSQNDDEITITVTDEDALPDFTNGLDEVILKWFGVYASGKSFVTGDDSKPYVSSTSKVTDYLTYEDLGNNSCKVTANGYNGSTVTDSVTVTFEVDNSTPVYVAYFWGLKDRNHVQVALKNVITGDFVAENDLPDISEAVITVNGDATTVSADSEVNGKDGSRVNSITTFEQEQATVGYPDGTGTGNKVTYGAYRIYLKDHATTSADTVFSGTTQNWEKWFTAESGASLGFAFDNAIIIAAAGTMN